MAIKKVYHLGDDLFIAVAFVSFTIGSVLGLLGIKTFWKIFTAQGLVRCATISLLFSIALSLYDMAHTK